MRGEIKFLTQDMPETMLAAAGTKTQGRYLNQPESNVKIKDMSTTVR